MIDRRLIALQIIWQSPFLAEFLIGYFSEEEEEEGEEEGFRGLILGRSEKKSAVRRDSCNFSFLS